MIKYQKINTIFKRDEHNIIIPDEYTLPEFEQLENIKWECTEKIDGTNMSVQLIPIFETVEDSNGEPMPLVDTKKVKDYNFEIHGRTESSNIPSKLLIKIQEIFNKERIIELFTKRTVDENGVELVEPPKVPIEIYGEGYGAKIQKGGGNYIANGVDFILFDIKVGDFWLNRDSLEDIASKLNIKIVPLIGYMTIPEAIAYVNNGFKSTIAENKDYDAEGLVLKVPSGLLRRNGERLVTKIKTVDFRKYAQNQWGRK